MSKSKYYKAEVQVRGSARMLKSPRRCWTRKEDGKKVRCQGF